MTLGIIAGTGDLPLRVAEAYTNSGGQVVVAKIIDTSSNDYSAYLTTEFHVGAVGYIFEYFRTNNVAKIIMAGGLARPRFIDLKVDSTGAVLLARIAKAKFLGDDKLLRIVASFIEAHGFTLVAVEDIIQDMTLSAGVATTKQPTQEDLNDIEIGIAEAKKLGAQDLGQAVIIEHAITLGVEGSDGTDALIVRCGFVHQKRGAGVLVKVMKPTQDQRFDMPTIGMNTVRNVAIYGFAGIAVEADKVIIIDRIQVINEANNLGIFIVAI